MSAPTNSSIKLGTPSVASLLPEDHYSYEGSFFATKNDTKRGFIKLPAKALKLFRGLGTGMKILFGTLFFVLCLALPVASAATVVNIAYASTPIEAIRNQDVPSSGEVQQVKHGIQIDVSWFDR